jgi:hypothetical protein
LESRKEQISQSEEEINRREQNMEEIEENIIMNDKLSFDKKSSFGAN